MSNNTTWPTEHTEASEAAVEHFFNNSDDSRDRVRVAISSLPADIITQMAKDFVNDKTGFRKALLDKAAEYLKAFGLDNHPYGYFLIEEIAIFLNYRTATIEREMLGIDPPFGIFQIEEDMKDYVPSSVFLDFFDDVPEMKLREDDIFDGPRERKTSVPDDIIYGIPEEIYRAPSLFGLSIGAKL